VGVTVKRGKRKIRHRGGGNDERRGREIMGGERVRGEGGVGVEEG